MMSENTTLRSATAAAAGASLLILISGLSYRALAAHFRVHTDTTPIAPETLERFPMQVAAWTGEDLPLGEDIVRKTGTDASINRRYFRNSGMEDVLLYISCGVDVRNQKVHRPEVCYIASGWTLTEHRVLELPLPDGTVLPCMLLEFSRGALDTTKVEVIHYYIIDGHFSRSFTQWRHNFWRIGYVAQVQIAASKEALTTDATIEAVSAFAIESAMQIRELFADLDKTRASGLSVRVSQEKR